jgi:hypothetical protein
MLGILIVGLFLITLIACAYTYGVLSWGLVFYKAYNWFIPALFTLSPITFAQSIAINLMIMVIVVRSRIPSKDEFLSFEEQDEDKKKDGYYKLVYFLIAPWITLFFVWATKLFLM